MLSSAFYYVFTPSFSLAVPSCQSSACFMPSTDCAPEALTACFASRRPINLLHPRWTPTHHTVVPPELPSAGATQARAGPAPALRPLRVAPTPRRCRRARDARRGHGAAAATVDDLPYLPRHAAQPRHAGGHRPGVLPPSCWAADLLNPCPIQERSKQGSPSTLIAAWSVHVFLRLMHFKQSAEVADGALRHATCTQPPAPCTIASTCA